MASPPLKDGVAFSRTTRDSAGQINVLGVMIHDHGYFVKYLWQFALKGYVPDTLTLPPLVFLDILIGGIGLL